jgi:guanine deaminase
MTIKILRGQVLTFKGDPFLIGDQASLHYESDGLLILENGLIKSFGSYASMKDVLPDGLEVKHYKDSLIIPGLIDTHIHYPQTQIIGAYGKQLIDWLNNYTFIDEQQFADFSHAQKVAKVFVQESLRAGTTTSAVYATVHPHSVDAIFEEAQKFNMRMIAGKVLMDRNSPVELNDTAQSG